MSSASLLIGILVIIVLAVFAYAILSSGASASPGRKLWRGSDGELIAIGDRQSGAADRLVGRGSATSDALHFDAGAYRIDYQFEALTRVALIDANGDDTLFIKGGAGTEALNISETGRYRLLVEPADEGASWQIAYRPLGSLPTVNDRV